MKSNSDRTQISDLTSRSLAVLEKAYFVNLARKNNDRVLVESYETPNCTAWTGVGVTIDGVLIRKGQCKETIWKTLVCKICILRNLSPYLADQMKCKWMVW